jgi:hypothetical protein
MLAAVALDGVLGDVVFLVITVAFFAVAWALVRVCERIAGAETVASAEARGAEAAVSEVKAA